MKALTVCSSGAEPSTEATRAVAETLVAHLSEQGTVGAISRAGTSEDGRGGTSSTNDDGSAGGGPPASDGGQLSVRAETVASDANGDQRDDGQELQRHYHLSPDGTWRGDGQTLTLSDALDDLAQSCDYAVIEGFSSLRLPTVVVESDQHADSETVTGETDGEAVPIEADSVLAHVTGEEFDPEQVVEALAETDPYETLASLVAQVKQSGDTDRAGAIATFTGRVRVRDHEDDEATEYLEFERYDSVAAEMTATIREELESRDGVYDVRLHHRTGVVEGGEDIVFVVVLAGHREEAFQTVQDGINRLKDEVPLFKKEVTESEEFWVQTGSIE